MRHRYVFLLIGCALFFASGAIAFSATQPSTLAEIALYRGADREKMLVEGAKKEGKLTLYTVAVSQRTRPILNAFRKRYPFITVEDWRGGTNALVPKVLEEYKVRRYQVDTIGLTQAGTLVLTEAGVLQEFHSPQMANFEEEVITRGPKGGAYAVGNIESGLGLGFSTKLLTKAQAPKTHRDLLDPKWKSKMVVTGGNQGSNWLGAMIVTYGEAFVNQFAKQDISVHMISARALTDLLIAQEYSLSPTITDAHVLESQEKGGPIDWVPLEPVGITLGQVLVPIHAPHPHAAMLYTDFELSMEAGKIFQEHGYRSVHKDLTGPKTYKKFYGATSTKQVREWREVFDRLFLQK